MKAVWPKTPEKASKSKTIRELFHTDSTKELESRDHSSIEKPIVETKQKMI